MSPLAVSIKHALKRHRQASPEGVAALAAPPAAAARAPCEAGRRWKRPDFVSSLPAVSLTTKVSLYTEYLTDSNIYLYFILL